MARPSKVSIKAREGILEAWAAGEKSPAISALVGLPAHTAHNVVVTARRQGDPRATMRNFGAAWRPQPVSYTSSRAFLDDALRRARERQAVWERSDMGRRMAEIAVPPANRR